jgi:hypothetical protein
LGGIIAVKLGWKHAFGIVAIPGMIVANSFLFVKDYKTVDLSFTTKTVKSRWRKDMIKEFISRPSVLIYIFWNGSSCFCNNLNADMVTHIF